MRHLFLALLVALPAAPASAQVLPGPPEAHVSPDKKLQVELLVGPRGALPFPPITPGCAVNRLKIAPGGAVPMHVHEHSAEIVVVLKGGGMFTLNGKAQPVYAGATIYVPMGEPHAFVADKLGECEVIQVYDPAGPETRFKAWPAGK